jgi:hypothetical protein
MKEPLPPSANRQANLSVDSVVKPKEVLLQMMQLLWTNEYSRHIEADPIVPLHVKQEEAESAVVLALTLMNWLRRALWHLRKFTG